MPEEDGALISRALGLRLRLIDGRLRLFDDATGAPLLSLEDRSAEAAARSDALAVRAAEAVARATGEAVRAVKAEAKAAAETEARRLVERRIAELEAELRRRGG